MVNDTFSFSEICNVIRKNGIFVKLKTIGMSRVQTTGNSYEIPHNDCLRG